MSLLPNSPVPLSPYWLKRGLVYVSLGNGLFWTKDKGWTGTALYNGTPKRRPGKFGTSLGFGTSHGTGTTDRVDGPPFSTTVGFRSFVSFVYAVSAGGGGFGRVFQRNVSGLTQEDLFYASNAASEEMRYARYATTAAGSWAWVAAGTGIELNKWNCYGLTHDQRATGNTPSLYKNGGAADVSVLGASTGTYTVVTNTLSLGNRSQDNVRAWDGSIGPLFLFDHPDQGLTEKEHAELNADPGIIFVPLIQTSFAPPTPGHNLTGSNSTQTNTSANGALVQTNVLTGAGSSQANTSTAGAILQVGDLTGADSTQANAASTGAVGQTHVLTGAGGTQANTSSAGALTFPGIAPVVSDDYERSSVNVALSVVTGTGNSAVIELKPRPVDNETSGTRWLEPSARITGVDTFRPTFKFLDYGSGAGKYHGYPWQSTRRPMFSYDRVTFYYFDTQTINATNIEFRHNTAFTSDVVYISRGRQVTPRQLGQFFADIATTYSAFAGPTASALAFTPTLTSWPGQSLITGEFSPQTDELARTVPATPFYSLRINDTSLMPGTGAKAVAVITTGIHAGEDLADIALMRMIEHLCGNSVEAQGFRRQFDLRVYGMINAPGRQGGGWRSGFTQGTGGADDAARHFPPQSDAGLETVIIPRNAITSDLAGSTPAFIMDMHGTFYNNWSTVRDPDNAMEAAFNVRLAANSGFTVGDEGDSTLGTIGYWGEIVLGLGTTAISITVEHGDPVMHTDADYVTWGAALVKSLYELHQYTGANVVQTNSSSTGAITQPQTLTAATTTQDNTSSSGAWSSAAIHALTGASATQANSSTGGVLIQVHTLSGAGSTQGNTSPGGALSGVHVLTGAGSAQGNTSTANALVQIRVLTGANSVQVNTSPGGALDGVHVLTGANSIQVNSSTASAFVQTRILTGANSSQANQSSVASIGEEFSITFETFTIGPCVTMGFLDAGAQLSMTFELMP